jgi:hypothetical protein
LQYYGQGQGFESNGWFPPPEKEQTTKLWSQLVTYLSNIARLSAQLDPLLKAVAKNNNLIVTAVSSGHVDLLVNFVCSSKARNSDMSNLVVFCLDEGAHKRTRSMGIVAFHDKEGRSF